MSLERKAIRHELRRLLLHRTVAQDRVSTNRAERVWEGELPALQVYHRREDPWRVLTDAPREYVRVVRVWVELFVAENATDVVDDLVDDLGAQVENLLLPNIALPSCPLPMKVDECVPEEWEFDFDAEGRKLIGAARWSLGFAWVHAVDEGDPTRRDALDTVGIDWDFPPPDGTLEAQDTLDVPTT